MTVNEYPDINELLDELLSKIKGIFGEKLVGLSLYGSLVWGDFDHDASDIDLLAVLTDDVSEKEFDNLKKMHDQFAIKHPDWKNRIEVSYLSTLALKTFKTKTSKATSISPGEPLNIKDIGKHWLMNWYIVREKGIALYGPDPKAIITPISKEEFMQSVRDHTASWNEWVKDMRNRKAQTYAILTMCRAYYAFKKGEQPSKIQAALWAKEQLPQWSELIDKALAWRKKGKDYAKDEENYPKTVEFVDFIRSKILMK